VNVKGFPTSFPYSIVVVFTIGGGKLSFWPEKLPGLTTLTAYPPGSANPII
jgi:hypothetical protein